MRVVGEVQPPMLPYVHTVELNAQRRHTPHAVLVFPVIADQIVWVKHPSRGWEVPGGKIEPGETPEEAANREAWEESGAVLDELVWLGEYGVPDTCGEILYKWVYVGRVRDVGSRPVESEIIDVRCFHPPITPNTAKLRPDVSPVMQDEVFSIVWPLVLSYAERWTV